MTDRLNETLADIQNMLTRFTWEVMDEDQRDEVMTKIVVPRWGKTTRDGKVLKSTLWAETLGTTYKTIEGRYRRIIEALEERNSRSEAISSAPNHLTTTQKAQVRGVRAATRSPEVAKAMVADPEVRAALAEAIAAKVGSGPDIEAQRAAAEKARREEQEKAAAEKREANARHQEELRQQAEQAKKEKLEALARLEKRLTDEAESSSFDLTTLSREQKAEIMTVLANDPEQATEWFKAQEDARKAKNTAAAEKAAEAHRKRIEQMEDRERRTSLAKASEDYEHSALKAFLKLEAAAQDVKSILEDKGGVTFSQIISSKRLANEWITATELVEDVAVAVRESIFEANAESQLQDVTE